MVLRLHGIRFIQDVFEIAADKIFRSKTEYYRNIVNTLNGEEIHNFNFSRNILSKEEFLLWGKQHRLEEMRTAQIIFSENLKPLSPLWKPTSMS
jgi:hypothetical protein